MELDCSGRADEDTIEGNRTWMMTRVRGIIILSVASNNCVIILSRLYSRTSLRTESVICIGYLCKVVWSSGMIVLALYLQISADIPHCFSLHFSSSDSMIVPRSDDGMCLPIFL